MRPLISLINITLDGFCDHTAGIPIQAIHDEAAEAMRECSMMLFGRRTFELMVEGWEPMMNEPSGVDFADNFARVITETPKLVFSRTLTQVSWNNSTLATEGLEETVRKLKSESGKPLLVGSPSLIAQLTQLRLIDEYRFWIQPFILGRGLRLFPTLDQTVPLKLIESKKLEAGVLSNRYAVGEAV